MANPEMLYNIIDLFFKGGWRVAPFYIYGGAYRGVKNWVKRAATSHEELSALVSEVRAEKFFFGVVPSEGQYVVDLDNKGEVNGSANWDKHIHDLFPLGDAPRPICVTRTKSGGFHLYFHHTKKIKIPSPTAILGKKSGVDIRGYTGMAVMPTVICEYGQWSPGTYALVNGSPDATSTPLPFNLIVPKAALKTSIDFEISHIQSAIQATYLPPNKRADALPEFIIPESARDQTLYLAAKLCRRADMTQDDALLFIEAVAMRCEVTDAEPIDHWISIGKDKIRRAFEGVHSIRSISDFYAELEFSGLVKCATEVGSVFYSRFGSRLLNISPRRVYTFDGLKDLVRGKVVSVTPEGKSVYAHTVINNWESPVVVDSYGMLPKDGMPFFENSAGHRCVNTYIPTFEGFQPDPLLLQKANEEMVPLFQKLVAHVAGGPEAGEYLMQKFAWMIQKPYMKPVTANIIYSEVRGVGKDSLLDLIGQLIHKDYYIKLQEKDFESRFAVFHEKLVAVFSEVQLASTAYSRRELLSMVGRLKQLITNRQITIEEKFKPARIVDSYTTFFLLSNYALHSIMEPGERRLDVFHSIEKKIDQKEFGPILDLANKQNRLDHLRFDPSMILYWDHCLYAIYQYLYNLELKYDFSKHEALQSDAKQVLMDKFASEESQWLHDNLPAVFTKEMVQWLSTMSPFRIDIRYAFNNLQENFGDRMLAVKKNDGGAYRLRGAPILVAKDDGNGRKMYHLQFTPSQDISNRSQLYTFQSQKIGSIFPETGEAFIKQMIESWAKSVMSNYFGSLGNSTLPGQKQSDVLN